MFFITTFLEHSQKSKHIVLIWATTLFNVNITITISKIVITRVSYQDMHVISVY